MRHGYLPTISQSHVLRSPIYRSVIASVSRCALISLTMR